jgi:hypothetical protein
VVALGLMAGRLRKRLSFSQAALGSLMVSALLTIVFAYNRMFWVALPLLALINGLGIFFNINTGSLRQAIVPNHLLGRIISIAGVLAWSAIPLGGLLGGYAVKWTGDVALVYAVIGGLTFAVALYFFLFSPLGHAERYLPGGELEVKWDQIPGQEMVSSPNAGPAPEVLAAEDDARDSETDPVR